MCAKIQHKHSKKSPPGESGSLKRAHFGGRGTCHPDPGGVTFMTYADQLKSPKWQKKRLEILERDNYTCRLCGDKESELHVHHLIYRKGVRIYDVDETDLLTLCHKCHTIYHEKVQSIFESFIYIQVNNGHGYTISDIDLIINVLAIDDVLFDEILNRARHWSFHKFLAGELQ